jgi:hypothetical protein
MQKYTRCQSDAMSTLHLMSQFTKDSIPQDHEMVPNVVAVLSLCCDSTQICAIIVDQITLAAKKLLFTTAISTF